MGKVIKSGINQSSAGYIFPLRLLCVHNAGEMRGNILKKIDVFFKSTILKWTKYFSTVTNADLRHQAHSGSITAGSKSQPKRQNSFYPRFYPIQAANAVEHCCFFRLINSFYYGMCLNVKYFFSYWEKYRNNFEINKWHFIFHTTKLKAWPRTGGTYWTVYQLYFYTPKNDYFMVFGRECAIIAFI